MTTSTTTITDQITLVVLDVRIWSGRKKLSAEDLNLSPGETPPEELITLGSKRICDPELLKPFFRLKQNAERICLGVGTRFLSGFAVPNNEADAVASELYRLKAEYDQASDVFLKNYDSALAQWIESLPAWEAPIRRAIEPAESVANRLKFGFQLIQINPSDNAGTLHEEVAGLGDSLFGEIELMARDLEGSFAGRQKLHRKSLATFARIREKLACLSFLDIRIAPIVKTLDDWTRRLPESGAIEGPIFNEGMGLALLLSDSSLMSLHGAGQLSLMDATTEAIATANFPPSVDNFGKDADADADMDPIIPSKRPFVKPENTSFYF
ncbi:DUF3150 domain-containing protein [Thiocapsa marina]|uniref:DUF3150 domain-containing protein n=1 Tax=Thiocapsa marina 5811 TaxID=768671 RepID=F9UH27_9GAMM|nr:DUF3150 domain-containing protein [Thiocapsa marina]EGV16431.1 hypothetical protein ThimaDRAFT_4200 [Thiocapsa marina 5811]